MEFWWMELFRWSCFCFFSGVCFRGGWCVELTVRVVFVLLGLFLGEGVGVLDLGLSPGVVWVLAEVVLVWVFFADAVGLSFRAVWPEVGLYVWLLLFGLLLCVGFGVLVAVGLLPGVSGWAALCVAVVFARTDAVLGAAVMAGPVVPARVRRLICVEGGLGDGIAARFVVVALAGVAVAGGMSQVRASGGASCGACCWSGLWHGAGAGCRGGGCVVPCAGAGRPGDVAGVGVLALAFLSFTLAVAVGGNGFVAGFVAGLAFGSVEGAVRRVLLLVEQAASVFSVLVWLLFGAVLVSAVFGHLTWQAVL
ncbi:cation:proton antiporter [Streptomyces sp. NPDC059896]|uniref:cation:proton antiporter domain-containing protein n=1 Tax=Streptomyces sp. NPDC059896 TaxID=3346993 RepID=UPI003652C250